MEEIKLNQAEENMKKAKDAGTIQPSVKFIYCIKDLEMGFLDIFESKNHMIALRSFNEACNDEKLPIHKYPEKYELWYIGQMNSLTGELIGQLSKLAVATQYAPEK